MGTYEEVVFRAPFSDTDLTSIEARSGDGTMIPVSVSFPEGYERDGNRPVWLHAYGGFGNSSRHFLRTAHRIWLQSGGIVATVHARGGRERGKEWHEAAKKEQLGKTFEDVIAAAEWFVDEGWSRPGRIAISGSSNGGLTSMASVSRRPDLFGAAISGAGVHDLIRGPELPGHWWGKEYGRDGTVDRAIREQNSPVHAEPASLPPVFIHTGIEDPTVPPAHSYRLVEAWSEIEGGPVLLRIWPWASHMWHYPEKKRRERSREFTPEAMQRRQIEPLLFLLKALDVDASMTFVPER